MATIANLAKQEDGSFTGTLLIPSLNGAKIVLAPVEKGWQSDGPQGIARPAAAPSQRGVTVGRLVAVAFEQAE